MISDKVKQNTMMLTTTNSRYIPIASKLLKTFNDFHPEILFCLLGVNLSDEEKNFLYSLHSNLKIIDDNQEFDNFHHEKCYCAHNRTWQMPDLMEKYKCNIFWMDADVFLKDNIDELFNLLQKADFAVRVKEWDPFRCNCGMVWTRYSEKNIEILKEWKKNADELGLLYWYSDQEGLNKTMSDNMDKIVFMDFPKKFNGISTNQESVIVHMKGPKNI
tara:strand:- start:5289 stop:5939 length:651 start_codon:yes stop_codon:yes gene_type:complete